jgi:Fic-DOC domain mobile mystery protein B
VSGAFDEPADATPLSPEERDGLIPSHVTLRSELNELEQENILLADAWVFQRKRPILGEPFGRNLHGRMFGQVWRWAGRYRRTNKNIGVDHWLVEPRLRDALDNTRYWIEHQSFEPDEIAARFHHALVFIHPFANGNGRWGRLMADVLAVSLARPRFTWGRTSLRDASVTRRAYVAALRAADDHRFEDIVAFARS